MVETRQYLDEADDLLVKYETARDFFNAMLQRYPNAGTPAGRNHTLGTRPRAAPVPQLRYQRL